jgi:hypothetical protein
VTIVALFGGIAWQHYSCGPGLDALRDRGVDDRRLLNDCPTRRYMRGGDLVRFVIVAFFGTTATTNDYHWGSRRLLQAVTGIGAGWGR